MRKGIEEKQEEIMKFLLKTGCTCCVPETKQVHCPYEDWELITSNGGESKLLEMEHKIILGEDEIKNGKNCGEEGEKQHRL